MINCAFNVTKRFRVGALVCAAVVGPALSQAVEARRVLGVFNGWAAFSDDRPSRCYAITGPAGLPPGARSPAFASVGFWRAGVAGQFHMRLGRRVRPGSAVLLTIDERVFQLQGRGVDAWTAGPATDRAVVAALRTGVEMSVAARDENGRGFVDAYRLSGAATAIDAAALACRSRRSS